MSADAATKPAARGVHARPSIDLVASAARYGSATLHEAAGRTGALPSAIKPVAPSFRACGPALTVRCAPGDNLWLHRAIYAAQSGDVIAASVSDDFEWGYWGEIMSTAALARGLGGLVVDGCVRDRERLERLGFPVFARGISIRGTSKDRDAPGSVNEPIMIGRAVIAPGDLLLGDADGVVALPRERLAETLDRAAARERAEEDVTARLARGERTLDIYGWD